MTDVDKLNGRVKMKVSTILKKAWPYLKSEWVRIFISLILVLIIVIGSALLPRFFSYITDALKDLADGKTPLILFDSIAVLVIGYACIMTFVEIVAFFQSILLHKAGTNIVYRLRMDVFVHIENMSQDQFNQIAVGSLVTRVANYTEAMSNFFTNTLVSLLRNILTVIVVFMFMLYTSWQLALITLVFAMCTAIFSYFMWRKLSSMFHKERGLISDFNAFLSEHVSGTRITQVFNQEKRQQKVFNHKADEMFKIRYHIDVMFALLWPTIMLFRYGALLSIFGVGISLSLSAGTITAMYLYISRFFEPIQSIADQVNMIQRALTASERLFNLMDVPPEVVDEEDAIEIDNFEGKIEFKNVWFAYEEENWILKDVSFVVNPKEMVAFVGATGAGKTTILSLIVRNYKIQKGQIFIDDIDINHIKIASLRKAVGQMLQDVFLFSGTIKSNISLRDEDFSEEQIVEACKYVNADTFIDKLPNKLEEHVAEGGNNFSAGQRQLLSFARTVLHNPKVLILDEATANIDTETEIIIQDSLRKISSIGTMLVVAHRLSTIQHANNIIVIQNGEIIEQGNHQQLLAQKGYYYKLYQLQLEKSKAM